MTTQQEIIQLIRAELFKLQLKNSSYSMRAFAKKLKSSPSVISEILNNRRPITKKAGARILQGLSLSEEKRNQLLANLTSRNFKAKTNSGLPTFSKIDSFNLISNWYYFGILSLAETKNFKSDPAWIAKRLNIKVSDTKKAIETLLHLELLKKNKAGHLQPTGNQFETSTDVRDTSIQKFHMENLEISRHSLKNHPIEIRDFSAMTVTFDPSQMQKAKTLIRKFRHQFSKEVEKTKKNEVYRLSIQFVPLSQEIK